MYLLNETVCACCHKKGKMYLTEYSCRIQEDNKEVCEYSNYMCYYCQSTISSNIIRDFKGNKISEFTKFYPSTEERELNGGNYYDN